MKDVLMLNLSVRDNNRLTMQAKKFLNYRTPKNVRMNMLRPSNYSYELMSYIVGEVVEMLNLSEIAAYLHNFVGDLGNNRLPEIEHKKFPSQIDIFLKLSEISAIFADYWGFYLGLDAIIEYASDEDKE